MTDADIICGITIDLTPTYKNRQDWTRCRKHLVSRKAVHPAFRKALGRCGAESLSQVLLKQLGGKATCHVRCTVDLIEFDAEDDLRDVFCVDIDVMGDLDLLEVFGPVVEDVATSTILCRALKGAAKAFSKQEIPGPPVAWDVEFSEYRE